jgi:hypothetical protein
MDASPLPHTNHITILCLFILDNSNSLNVLQETDSPYTLSAAVTNIRSVSQVLISLRQMKDYRPKSMKTNCFVGYTAHDYRF